MYNTQTDILEYKNFRFEDLFQKFSQQDYIINYVKDNLIFLGISGSYAYNMESDESDLDIVGIFKDNIDMILGYKKIDQIEYKDNDLDITIYSLSKALKLIIDQNPNMIELVFVNKSDILYKTEDYDYIKSRNKEMLSKLSRHKFAGYAMSQLKRIKGHSKWMVKEQEGKFDKKPEMIDYCRIIRSEDGETIRQKDMIKAYNKYSFLTHETETIFKIWEIKKSNFSSLPEKNINGWFDNENCTFYFKKNIGEEKDFRGLLFFAKDEFDQALNEYNKWKEWKKNRNPKRHELEEKYNYDTKHACHLFRLLLGGLEILEKCDYSVRRPEKDFLNDIRNGKYPYKWVLEEAERYDAVLMPEAYEKSILQNSIDKKLYIEIMKKVLKI